jgi:hypothetical protein
MRWDQGTSLTIGKVGKRGAGRGVRRTPEDKKVIRMRVRRIMDGCGSNE